MKHDTDPWLRFSQTILEIFFDGVHRIDLRLPVDGETRETLQSLGLDGAFAILTACNPGGGRAGEAANHTATEALETELAMQSRRFLRADGVSGNGSHRERGAAVCISRAAALEIARCYGQAAIFWFDGERFWIVAASGEREALALPVAGRLSISSAS